MNQGEEDAYGQLVAVVYEELRRKARQIMYPAAAGHTLQPTALVHEAFAKLVGSQGGHPWQTSRHFFNAAAEVMRQILLDHAKAKGRQKRGGGLRPLGLEHAALVAAPAVHEVECDGEVLDAALAELQKRDERRYRVVMLRYFAGLSDAEIASCLDVSEKTVQRNWKSAKLFLIDAMGGEPRSVPCI